MAMSWMLKQKEGLKISPLRAALLFIIGTLDCALFGGAVFGWPQLVYTLKKEGIFRHLCEGSNSLAATGGNYSLEPYILSNQVSTFEENNFTTQLLNAERDLNSFISVKNTSYRECLAQDERFSLIFTFTLFIYGFPGIFVGLLLHYGGLVLTRFLAGSLVGISFLCMSATTYESPNWLWPAMILLALSGCAIRMSVLQLGDLYPQHRSMAITFLSGVYSFGASLFLLFQVMNDVGIGRQSVCYFLSAMGLFSAIASFLAPSHHIPFPDEDSAKDGKLDVQIQQPLSESVKTTSFLLYTYYNIIGIFALSAYQAIYNVWVTASTSSATEVRILSNMFSYSSFFSAFIGPLAGCFTDCLIRKAQMSDYSSDKLRMKKIQANFFPLFLTTVFMASMYSCLFFKNYTIVMVSLVCQILFRPNVIATPIAFLRIRFPGDHFNRLIGIGNTTAAIMQLMQYPFFLLTLENDYLAHGIVMALILLNFAFPFHLLYKKALVGDVSNQRPSAVPSMNVKKDQPTIE